MQKAAHFRTFTAQFGGFEGVFLLQKIKKSVDKRVGRIYYKDTPRGYVNKKKKVRYGILWTLQNEAPHPRRGKGAYQQTE